MNRKFTIFFIISLVLMVVSTTLCIIFANCMPTNTATMVSGGLSAFATIVLGIVALMFNIKLEKEKKELEEKNFVLNNKTYLCYGNKKRISRLFFQYGNNIAISNDMESKSVNSVFLYELNDNKESYNSLFNFNVSFNYIGTIPKSFKIHSFSINWNDPNKKDVCYKTKNFERELTSINGNSFDIYLKIINSSFKKEFNNFYCYLQYDIEIINEKGISNYYEIIQSADFVQVENSAPDKQLQVSDLFLKKIDHKIKQNTEDKNDK